MSDKPPPGQSVTNSHNVVQIGSIQADTVKIEQVYRDDRDGVLRYLRDIADPATTVRDWRECHDLRSRYIDLRAEATADTDGSDDERPPLVPTCFAWDLGQDAGSKPAPVESLREALKQHQQIALIGAPGAGKSTALRMTLLDAAEACLQDAESHPLPVYLRLNIWPNDAPTLFAWVDRHFKAHNIRNAPLGRHVLLLLDGLNEMAGQGREARIASIRAFLDEYSGARLIVTCREQDYAAGRLDDVLKLDRLTALPLDDDRIRAFLRKYLPEQADALWEAIQPEGYRQKERVLLELARNPYLLALLAAVYARQGCLPESRADLFRRVIGERWKHEARETRKRVPPGNCTVRDFTYAQFTHALGDLAFAMIDQSIGTSADPAWAKQQFPVDLQARADDLLAVGEGCSVLVLDGGSVRFYHQLMQEYFAARALDWRGDTQVIASKLRAWQETLVMRAGMGEAARGQAITVCSTALRDADDDVRLAAAEALVRIGAPSVDLLCAALRDTDEYMRSDDAEALGQIGDARAVEPLSACLEDTEKPWWSHKRVCDMAAEALRRIGTPEALAALREHGFETGDGV